MTNGVTTGASFTAPTISACELYINNIFVNPEVHDIYIRRIGFTLIRVHRRQSIRLDKSQDEKLLNNMKWPIETMYIGARPTANLSSVTDWHKFVQVTNNTINVPAVIPNSSPPPTHQVVVATAQYQTHTPTLQTVTISAHSIPIYNQIPAQFFNSYIPTTYGGHNINAPEDAGLLMVTFNLYPGSYQP
ncbi:hypothetical protein BNJ_00237 [Kaumoebavirus]|uniref:hypothetical protein n=1 Tax=Kaumoebavirus TaxID=1859492 RepID=UPI0009C272D0|nr:hypothetical protein BNJ_00237 [Kaumoebavirus]ARA72066.1 hypothetical protein BNJ_00237 [Kaumoebavirus]